MLGERPVRRYEVKAANYPSDGSCKGFVQAIEMEWRISV